MLFQSKSYVKVFTHFSSLMRVHFDNKVRMIHFEIRGRSSQFQTSKWGKSQTVKISKTFGHKKKFKCLNYYNIGSYGKILCNTLVGQYHFFSFIAAILNLRYAYPCERFKVFSKCQIFMKIFDLLVLIQIPKDWELVAYCIISVLSNTSLYSITTNNENIIVYPIVRSR
jgi:hypothetical protein